MWFVIILIIVAVIIFMAKKYFDKAKAEQIKREKAEKKKKAETEAKARAVKFEVITDYEKQKFAAKGNDILSTTLNVFNKAKTGDAGAMFILAVAYQGIEIPSKAFYWMQKASKKGNTDAMYWLGEFYVSGYGVSKDKMKGVHMIMNAATEGNKEAIKSLKENGMTVADMRSIGINV